MEDKLKAIGNACFWTAVIIELIVVIIDKSAYTNPYEGIIFRITFLLFCVKVFTTKYSRCEWLCMAIVGLIVVISYFVNERDEAVRAAMFVFACKDVPIKRLLKVVLAVTLTGAIVLFGLAVTGIYGKLAVTANFGRGPSPGIVETRYCFGMGHPNAFQCMIFMMSTVALYLWADKMRWYHFIAVAAANYIMFIFTDSNTAMLVILAVVLGIALLRYCEKLRNGKAVYILGALLVLAVVAFSAVGSHVGIETPFMYSLDQVLNGRFQYAHQIENARIENWHLFAAPENQEYFDQGFIRLFYWYGIIPGIVYVLGNLYLIYQSWLKKDYCLLVIVAGYAVFSIMEAHLISVYLLRNYLLVWLGYYCFQPVTQNQNVPCGGYLWQLPQMLVKGADFQ